MSLCTSLRTPLAHAVPNARRRVRQGPWTRMVWGLVLGLVWGVCSALAQSSAVQSSGAQNTPAQSAVAQSPEAQSSRPEVASLKGAKPSLPVRLRVWGFQVYDARLWVFPAFRHGQYPEHAFALELQYLRRLEGAAIASSSLSEMRRVGSFTEAQAQSWEAALRGIFPDIGPGERITGVNLPGVGVEFWVNGQRVGSVADPLFARLFFGIWLNERTSEPKLRTQLLQGLAP